jgi:molybdenum cofactor cytidylyltransferase
MAEFDAVVLAAGLSKRMGAQNKLLLRWQGMPLIERVVRTYLAVVDGPVTVITGHEASQIGAALRGLPVALCHNADFETGQQSSVLTALKRPSDAKATLLGLGDQPLLTPDDLLWLMDQHRILDADKISIPGRNGSRGNPIVIPHGLRSDLLENPKSPGCRRFTRDHPECVQMIDCASSGFFSDVDTPDDFAQLLAHTKVTHAAFP